MAKKVNKNLQVGEVEPTENQLPSSDGQTPPAETENGENSEPKSEESDGTDNQSGDDNQIPPAEIDAEAEQKKLAADFLAREKAAFEARQAAQHEADKNLPSVTHVE